MTLEKMRTSTADCLTVYDLAEFFGCDPQRLRDALDIDDDLPIDQRKFLFPHCKIGNRHRISREGFVAWATLPVNIAADVMKKMGWMGGAAN